MPFQKALLQLETQSESPPVLFVIFPEQKTGNWIVRAVSGEAAFENRQGLP